MAQSKPPIGENQDKAAQVQQMFAHISSRYDLLNRVLSFGIDQSWRLTAAREVLALSPRRVLDVATGTADFALTLKRLAPQAEVVGCDFVPQMLDIGRQKARQQQLPIVLEEQDALNMQYPDGSFDAISCAFGFRNFSDYRQGLREFYRVLAPGGRMVILEFPPPDQSVFGQLSRLYFSTVLPTVGGLLSGNKAAYSYLPESVMAFPKPAVLHKWMQETGFRSSYQVLTGGLAAIHIGVKP